MTDPLFYDTETIGFHGFAALIQYAKGGEEPRLHSVFDSDVADTMELIEDFMAHSGGMIAFNIAFDHFHLQKLYNTLYLLDPAETPADQIDRMILAEFNARDVDKCLKPQKVLDIMLHAQKGPYQSMMDRKAIRIRRVPRILAYRLADEMNKRIKFKDIYFAKRKTKVSNPWQVKDIELQDGTWDPNFKNIEINFFPSSGLKVLACDALNVDPVLYKDIDLPDYFYPLELGYAPCAKYILDLERPTKKMVPFWDKPYRWTWPALVQDYATHWGYNDLARKYAADDVRYLRELYDHFEQPPMNDNDSQLAIAVASCRWRGYSVDIEKVKRLKQSLLKVAKSAPTSAGRSLDYILPELNEEERIIFGRSTKKTAIETLAEWRNTCPACVLQMGNMLYDSSTCTLCSGTGEVMHPAAIKAKKVLEARTAEKRVMIFNKLELTNGRWHPSFKVIGAKSSRMSGTDGFSAHGINKIKEMRECFTLALEGEELHGGDFDAFEVGIADAVYGDPDLRLELQTGRKIHAIFGSYLYAADGEDYDSILKSSHTERDLYTRSKSALFAWLYAGTPHTLKTRLGIPEEQAAEGMSRFENNYRQIGIGRARVMQDFTPLRQPKGMGTMVEWHEPAQFKETLFGFKRYFDLEFQICRELFIMGQSPPKEWRELKVKVQRDQRDHERVQSVAGATQSALFGAAFGVQSACARAALNHEIQGSGSGVTKSCQVAVWDVQPCGIHEFRVMPMNMHDEILCTLKPQYAKQVAEIMSTNITKFKEIIPLMAMKWQRMATWAGNPE